MNNNSGNDKTMTIHDVARELGVSASTVSRAISGKAVLEPLPETGSLIISKNTVFIQMRRHRAWRRPGPIISQSSFRK